MALEGSLKEFGLADILQLLYYQHKTGVLTLQSKLDRVRLLFYEGNIVAAESKKRDVESKLGRVLVKKGLLTQGDLAAIIEEQKTSGGKLGALLMNKGLVTPEDIREVLTSQITELVVQLFSWKEGKYKFIPQGVPLDKDITLSLDTQHLLMEGLRLLDEWSVLKERISPDSVFEILRQPTEELSPEENEILKFVDGQNDVNAIADLVGIDSFEVSKILIRLLDKDIIARKTVVAPAEAAPVEAVPKETPILRLILVVFVLAALVITVFVYLTVSSNPYLKEFKASEEIDRLRTRLEIYRYEKGSYPLSLEETDPWGNPYIYKIVDDGFILKSSGADGKPDTEDDIY
jgi:DNA-binding Lrp family transcriptional regulator